MEQAEHVRRDDKGQQHAAGEDFSEMMMAFGQAIGEIFNDPELKTHTREFGDTAARSIQTLGQRLRDDEVQEKFRQAGTAAEQFGHSVAASFRSRPKD